MSDHTFRFSLGDFANLKINGERVMVLRQEHYEWKGDNSVEIYEVRLPDLRILRVIGQELILWEDR